MYTHDPPFQHRARARARDTPEAPYGRYIWRPIAHLAGSWFSFLPTTYKYFSRGTPNPKDPGFGGFRPIPVLLVPSIWPENACVMPNWKSDLPGYLARKIRFNGFFELNQMVFRTPQITYPRDA